MRVLVVYESMFGNTSEVATAVAGGLRRAQPDIDVGCVPVADAESNALCDLLVVGGPTHFLGMTSARSRGMAAQFERDASAHGRRLEPVAAIGGVREWIEALPRVSGISAAAFDTRLDKLIAGGAAKRIARQLRRKGFKILDHPTGFIVDDMTGPVRAGELDRASAWGTSLLSLRAEVSP